MKLLNAILSAALRTIAVIFALLAIPPAFFAGLLLFFASISNSIADEKP